MTRKEAVAKVTRAWAAAESHHGPGDWIAGSLEALGLLKFDDEVDAPVEKVRVALIRWGYTCLSGDLDDLLKKCGCKIVEDK